MFLQPDDDILNPTVGMQGADAQQLLKEASSYDTVGNGYFAMTIHAIPAGWRQARAIAYSRP